ncbi:MAG TPA: HEAT repeat domain-containing protein [Gemmatimonadales bacterium]|nr:HEAT repeat domain-containing protein [Gemmatimonadales bacterium]
MRALLLLVGVIGAGSAATAAGMLTSAHRGASVAESGIRDESRPGPDSARVAMLLDALSRTDPALCEMLSDQIGNFWNSSGEWGIGELNDARPGVRAAKDSISGQVRDPAAIRQLVARLSSDDPCVRRTAAKMLGGSTISDQELGRLLDDPSVRVREAALLAIGHDERPSLRPRVERMLHSDDVALVAMAAWTLGELEDHESVSPLQGLLDHASPRVRMTAAWALGEIEDSRAVRALLPLLRDREAGVRWAAAGALGNIESADAAPALEQLLANEPDRRVRLQSIEALGNIEAPRSAAPLARVIAGDDAELSLAAAEAIGNLDDLGHAPAELVRAASSPDPRMRRAVVSALANIEDTTTIRALLPLLTDADPDIRRDAIEALGEMNAQQAKPAITRALDDKEPEVRKAAVEALAELEDE